MGLVETEPADRRRFVGVQGEALRVLRHHQEPQIEVMVSGLIAARLSQRGGVRETAITGLGMAAGLQPAAQLGVVQERNVDRLDIDHQCAGGKVRFGLVPRERLIQTRQELAHLGEAERLGRVCGCMGV